MQGVVSLINTGSTAFTKHLINFIDRLNLFLYIYFYKSKNYDQIRFEITARRSYWC